MKMERVWAMPNKQTFQIKAIGKLIRHYMEIHPGVWLDPFSGGSKLATITNDLNPDVDANFHMTAKEFLSRVADECCTGLLIDPPYSPRQIKECYNGVGLQPTALETSAAFYSNLKDEAQRIVRVGDCVIWCGWNSNGVGKSRGFQLEHLLLVAHGGSHQDTIVTVERKVK